MEEYSPISLAEKFKLFSEICAPKIVARINDYDIRIVRFKGDFTWHKHDETDEMFMVLEGELRIDFRDGSVEIRQNELFVVPKGVEHKPFAEKECKILLIEPSGTMNTGNENNHLTNNAEWI